MDNECDYMKTFPSGETIKCVRKAVVVVSNGTRTDYLCEHHASKLITIYRNALKKIDYAVGEVELYQ